MPNEMIFLIDMDSTFPETVEQLAKWEAEGVQVRYQRENKGAWGLFRGIIQKEIDAGTRFFVNDPDVLPDPGCCEDLLDWLHELMDVDHPEGQWAKVGLGLRIDDLPDHFPHKQHTIQHESRFSRNKATRDIFWAPIATTFCLYRGMNAINDGDPAEGYLTGRTCPPNLGRHLYWYLDPANLDPDERYYLDHCPHRTAPKVPGSSWKI